MLFSLKTNTEMAKTLIGEILANIILKRQEIKNTALPQSPSLGQHYYCGRHRKGRDDN